MRKTIAIVMMLTLLLTILGVGSNSNATPVVLNMNLLPNFEDPNWSLINSGGTSWVSGGILTIDSPSYYEFNLLNPNGNWHQTVDNANGWVVETKMRVDPTTQNYPGTSRGAVQVWIHDHTYLTIVGFNKDKIYIAYPDYVPYYMDTTNTFHVYRIEAKGLMFKVYVDGSLAIDYHRSWTGGGSNILMFGDGVSGWYSRSYWDYFMYDTDPVTGIPADVRIEPQTLNLDSMGNYVQVKVEGFPDNPEYSPLDVDETSVVVAGVGADLKFSTFNNNRFIGKADRLLVEDAIGAPGNEIEVDVKGKLNDGTAFIGKATIKALQN